MPYRLKGKSVQKKNPGGSWITIKTHGTKKEALAHLAALKINVKERP